MRKLPPMTIAIDSKLPHVGTTIFTVMSALAVQHKAINLSQGFPDFDGPEALRSRVEYYLNSGFNQYPPMAGVPSLRQGVATKVADLYGAQVDAEDEVTITAGATEALFCAIAAVVRQGDEVIVFDPAYDSYEPVVLLQGGRTVHIPLKAPSYRPDWDQVRDAITSKTRLIIINTPHNPTGAVWQAEDLAELKSLVVEHGIFVVSDEVYEHIVFDGVAHESVCRDEELMAQSFVISSFGKTYHVTGWKVGYCVAPRALTKEFRRVHQFVNFTVNTPMQLGIADFLAEHPEHHLGLGAFYQKKRDFFCELLVGSRFSLTPSGGTYFQLLDYSAISDADDVSLAKQWTKEIQLASIPVSVFYADQEIDPREAGDARAAGRPKVLRFCFAKDDATLTQAAEILCSL
jgi:methionine aminotransferase